MSNGGKLCVHRFAMVTAGDKLQFRARSVRVMPAKMRGADLPLRPVWSRRYPIEVCGRQLNIRVKEIEGADELAGYEALVQHHYRSRAGATRRAPLIAVVDADDLPPVVGFVELSSCFLVNVPRKRILDNPFSDPQTGVAWECWDMDTAKKYTNAIARISRCVVYPELRGVGVAGILARAAVEFARDRWHIGGLRPCFLEITAEMLRYWPFVKKAGFVKIGDTEGNRGRLRKSMTYLLNRKRGKLGLPQGGGGIMTMYRAHATKLEQVMRERGWSVDEIVDMIARKPESLKVDDWVELHSIYRQPKPVYMLGLTDAAREHLSRHCADPAADPVRPSNASPVVIKDMNIRTACKPDTSPDARRIQEAFGIVAKSLEGDLISGLDWHLQPGTTTLVAGSSGSGKSLLLRALEKYAICPGRKPWETGRVKSRIGESPSNPARVVTLASASPKKSPIALLREHDLSLEDSMRILATAGLGEAQIFVRPAETLSSGQQYRLALALALAKNPGLLLIDEFCEPLDDYATAALCSRLRKEAARCGFCAVVATANSGRVQGPLNPHKILRLLPNGRHRWESPA